MLPCSYLEVIKGIKEIVFLFEMINEKIDNIQAKMYIIIIEKRELMVRSLIISKIKKIMIHFNDRCSVYSNSCVEFVRVSVINF